MFKLSSLLPVGNALAVASRAAAVRTCSFPRLYSTSPLSKTDIESRVVKVLKNFDKCEADKVTATSHFSDLGLDSLDTVEVVMAIEEEFNVEIPDKEADEIRSVEQAIDYISTRKEAA